MPVTVNGFRVQESVVAPGVIHNKMLEFATVHDIKSIIKRFPLDKKGIDKRRLSTWLMVKCGIAVPQLRRIRGARSVQ